MKTLEQIRELAIAGCIAEKAHGDLGIYMKAVEGPNGYTERTEYQNGWNAAVMAQTEKVIHFYNFMDTLSKENRQALETLLLEELVELSCDSNNKVHISVRVNDIFYYAAEEEVFTEELQNLANLYTKYDWHGMVAWVAAKRNMNPIKDRYYKTEEYQKALSELVPSRTTTPEPKLSVLDKIKGLFGK